MPSHSKVPSIQHDALPPWHLFLITRLHAAQRSAASPASPTPLLQDAAEPRGGTVPVPAWGGCQQQGDCICHPLGTAVQPGTEHGELQGH